MASPPPVGATNAPRRARPGRDVATDEALLARVADHDHDALAALYRRHGPAAHALALRLCGPANAAEVVGAVFSGLWRGSKLRGPRRGRVQDLVLLQTHARAVEFLRGAGARRAQVPASFLRRRATGVEVDAVALAELVGDGVWRLLAGLPEHERDAIALAFYGGYTYRRTAALLKQPVGTVKQSISAGMVRLQAQLAGGIGGPTAPD